MGEISQAALLLLHRAQCLMYSNRSSDQIAWDVGLEMASSKSSENVIDQFTKEAINELLKEETNKEVGPQENDPPE
ncbi:RRM domain-containing protein [Psidium guajava]|nr:RRM domain-containing protein [Psidium guajava]